MNPHLTLNVNKKCVASTAVAVMMIERQTSVGPTSILVTLLKTQARDIYNSILKKWEAWNTKNMLGISWANDRTSTADELANQLTEYCTVATFTDAFDQPHAFAISSILSVVLKENPSVGDLEDISDCLGSAGDLETAGESEIDLT